MLLFTTLLMLLGALATVVLVFTGVVGTATLFVFGDIIVCVIIIMLLIKFIKGKK